MAEQSSDRRPPPRPLLQPIADDPGAYRVRAPRSALSGRYLVRSKKGKSDG